MERADPLGAVITLLQPRTVLSKVVVGAGAWSIRKPSYPDPSFCLLLEGSCYLDIDGLGPFDLVAGDFLLLRSMPVFTMCSDRNIEPLAVPIHYDLQSYPGARNSPTNLRLLGGSFRFDPANAHLLRRLLPPAIHIRRSEAGAERLRRIVELIADEASNAHPGRQVVLERLVQVLLVETLRFRPGSDAPERQGLLSGLADPALARAITALHEDVARRWTVADLARIACMSRAVFAKRFVQHVGMPPMEYLLEWRMAIAKEALRREQPPLAELAARVGYQSASAFSVAFTRLVGSSPRDFQRQNGDPGIPAGA